MHRGEVASRSGGWWQMLQKIDLSTRGRRVRMKGDRKQSASSITPHADKCARLHDSYFGFINSQTDLNMDTFAFSGGGSG